MDKPKSGHFYILGMGEKLRFWAVPLRRVGNDQIIILQYDEIKGKWKETVWGVDSFTFLVEVEKITNTVPVNLMDSRSRKESIRAILNRRE